MSVGHVLIYLLMNLSWWSVGFAVVNVKELKVLFACPSLEAFSELYQYFPCAINKSCLTVICQVHKKINIPEQLLHFFTAHRLSWKADSSSTGHIIDLCPQPVQSTSPLRMLCVLTSVWMLFAHLGLGPTINVIFPSRPKSSMLLTYLNLVTPHVRRGRVWPSLRLRSWGDGVSAPPADRRCPRGQQPWRIQCLFDLDLTFRLRPKAANPVTRFNAPENKCTAIKRYRNQQKEPLGRCRSLEG